ncbi:hypothetical protein HYW73_00500, partial [Candidatus Nomurabacteria bacterium]|nr:hypothetical protein [Candidatus Nomurabacteria bacterium]
KKTLKIPSLFVFFILIIGYAFFVSKDLIFGVKIKNVNITDGAAVSESVQKITGNAKNAVRLALNGREISINQAGDFNETIALLSGYNIISLRAQDKFGYIDEENYKLMFQP